MARLASLATVFNGDLDKGGAKDLRPLYEVLGPANGSVAGVATAIELGVSA